MDYDKQNVAFLAKMLGQKLLFVLEYEEHRPSPYGRPV